MIPCLAVVTLINVFPGLVISRSRAISNGRCAIQALKRPFSRRSISLIRRAYHAIVPEDDFQRIRRLFRTYSGYCHFLFISRPFLVMSFSQLQGVLPNASATRRLIRRDPVFPTNVVRRVTFTVRAWLRAIIQESKAGTYRPSLLGIPVLLLYGQVPPITRLRGTHSNVRDNEWRSRLLALPYVERVHTRADPRNVNRDQGLFRFADYVLRLLQTQERCGRLVFQADGDSVWDVRIVGGNVRTFLGMVTYGGHLSRQLTMTRKGRVRTVGQLLFQVTPRSS